MMMHNHHQHLKVQEKASDNSNIKPSNFLSANSNKIGASVIKNDRKDLYINHKDSSDINEKKLLNSRNANDKAHLMSTPQTKNVSGFSLPNNVLQGMGIPGHSNAKSNIKIPIPTYSIPNKLLFSNSSEAKQLIQSSESNKSSMKERYGKIGKIMQFESNPTNKEEAETG